MAQQTYQLVLTGNCAGQFVQNILHFRIDDNGFTNRLLAAKGLIDGFIAEGLVSAWVAMLPEEYILKSIKARRVTNGGGPEWIDVSADGEQGTSGDNMQMSGAGPVIIWFTDGGPRRVGKTFLPGISIDNVDGGEIKASFLTALRSSAILFNANFAATGGGNPTCTLCIPRHNDLSVRSLVVEVTVSKNVGQQRRRQLPV
jgi:hypothetical protein